MDRSASAGFELAQAGAASHGQQQVCTTWTGDKLQFPHASRCRVLASLVESAPSMVAE